MANESFATPCVGAIIERSINGEKYILIQTRWKEGGGETNGKLEIPAGKIREYENIYDALRREVYEETGLKISKIVGEGSRVAISNGSAEIVSFEPYCVTQNLAGAYSIILNTFVCEAVGEPLPYTNESRGIGWIKAAEVKRLIREEPDRIFFIHFNALRKYLRAL